MTLHNIPAHMQEEVKKVHKKKIEVRNIEDTAPRNIGPKALDAYVGDYIYVYKHCGQGKYHRYSGKLVDKEQGEYAITDIRRGNFEYTGAKEMEINNGDGLLLVKENKNGLMKKGVAFVDEYRFIDKSD